jgi:hypothetical protein
MTKPTAELTEDVAHAAHVALLAAVHMPNSREQARQVAAAVLDALTEAYQPVEEGGKTTWPLLGWKDLRDLAAGVREDGE